VLLTRHFFFLFFLFFHFEHRMSTTFDPRGEHMVSRRWVANEKHSGRPLLGKPEVLLETADKEGGSGTRGYPELGRLVC